MGNKVPSNLPGILRQRQTDAERKLWFRLRNRQLDGARFRRQHLLGKYIVDFVCLEKMLIVELDGGQHAFPSLKTEDARRDAWLEKSGYHIMRFWDNDVLHHIDGVVLSIGVTLEKQEHPHMTSPVEREEEKEKR